MNNGKTAQGDCIPFQSQTGEPDGGDRDRYIEYINLMLQRMNAEKIRLVYCFALHIQ